MIDRRPFEGPSPSSDPPESSQAEGGQPPQSGSLADLYSDLFADDRSRTSSGAAEPADAGGADQAASPGSPVPPPRGPTTLAETGLTLMQIGDLVLKHLYLEGHQLGVHIARQARLPFQVVDEVLRFLKDEKLIEVVSGDLIGPASYRFNLTDLGRSRARESFEQCRYVGPAPVPLKTYVEQCRLQTVAGTPCDPSALRKAFEELIIRPNLLEELGPAVCSGRSIFVYGPPGNGKTMIAKGLGKFLNANGGEIYVPYALMAENSIITLFDPTIHQPTETEEFAAGEAPAAGPSRRGESGLDEAPPDMRWRKVRRPVVMTGGELTLDMLDLRYNATSNFYTAPLHIKANSGVFLIDDFGRQIVSPRDLLNRWILPLEERMDYLTLATGKKFAVPFEQLIIFSTNLNPRELVDEAFLRRIRHKIEIGPPTRELYGDIFRMCCEQRGIPFDAEAVDYIYANFYDHGKTPRSSDPRDLLEIMHSICRFRHEEFRLTPELLNEATERFFCQV